MNCYSTAFFSRIRLRQSHKFFYLGVITLFLPVLVATKSYYIESDEGKIHGCRASDVLLIDQKASLEKSLNQKRIGACYGYAAYYLIQYFLNVQHLTQGRDENKDSSHVMELMKYFWDSLVPQERDRNKDQLSLIDFIAKGCHGSFNEGGSEYAVLHNIRKKEVYLNQEYDIEKVFDLSENLKKCGVNSDFCCTYLRQNFGILEEHLIEDWKTIFDKVISENKNTAAHHILFKGIKHKLDHATIPAYNVEVFEVTDELYEIEQQHDKSLTKEKMVQKEMRKQLQPTSFDSRSYPTALAFCPEERDDGTCSGAHAVAITGVRRLCCGGVCGEEWKIANSYGGYKDGWYKAGPLSESLVKHHYSITAIRPCKASGSDTSNLPLCQSHIQGPYPIHYLVKAKDLEGLKTLGADVSFKAKIDLKNNRGLSPLSIAIDKDLAIASYLVGQGADKENYYGPTLLIRAIEQGQLESVKYLVEQGVDKKNDYNPTPLIHAIEQGQLEIVRLLVEHGADKDKVDRYGLTPLNKAIELGHLEIVKYLVEQGADKDKVGKDGLTLLLRAVNAGHLTIVKYLIEQQGLDQEKADKGGLTLLLHAAVQQGYLEIVRYLVELGADKDKEDESGLTPLNKAVDRGYLEIVKYLVERGADKDKVDRYGLTPLQRAVRRHLEIAKYLVQQGADKEKADNDGNTPLSAAANANHLESLKYLVEHGADKNKANNRGETPLYRAVLRRRLPIVEYLIEQDADKEKADKFGRTPLNVATADIVEYLVVHGANVESADKDGLTPLYSAVQGGDLKKVKYLIKKGANPLDAGKNEAGSKAILDLAKNAKYNSHEIFEIISSYIDKYKLEHGIK